MCGIITSRLVASLGHLNFFGRDRKVPQDILNSL